MSQVWVFPFVVCRATRGPFDKLRANGGKELAMRIDASCHLVQCLVDPIRLRG